VNLEALGIFADIVAATAVVVSLLYLAVEVRGNTNATKAGTSASINDFLSRINDAFRSDPEFAEVWLRGCADLDSLKEVERVRFSAHLLDILNLAEYTEQLGKQGLAGTHIDVISWVALLYRENPGIRKFIDSMETVGNKELLERLKDPALAKGTNVFAASEYRR
jgi:hypothetical protein